MTVSCTDPHHKALAQRIAMANAECPITAADGIVIDALDYADDVVTYHVTVHSSVISVDALAKKQDLLAPALSAMIIDSGNESLNADLELCRLAKAKIRFVISDASSQIEFTLDPADCQINQ